ncbi:transposase [Streptomyces sioyaensis]|uniref:transposase n=1 Tax=Streptomyces sioyaensis TaxID=67364 RepID=UPI0037B01A8D
MERAELTDGDWELIRTFLPVGRFGPYPERLRQQFEGVIWRFRTGSQWRGVPPCSGHGRPSTTASPSGVTRVSSKGCWTRRSPRRPGAGRRICPWSAWTPRWSVPTTMRRARESGMRSWRPWRGRPRR